MTKKKSKKKKRQQKKMIITIAGVVILVSAATAGILFYKKLTSHTSVNYTPNIGIFLLSKLPAGYTGKVILLNE